jgi:hypothetical protein
MNDRTISGYAQAEIDALAIEGITGLTPAEIVEINAIAREFDNPAVARSLSRGTPVECGGAWLWPMTIRAAEWFDRVGCNLARESDREAAVGYAMTHGRTEGLELCVTLSDAPKAVRAWLAGLSCTMDEYRLAVAEVLDQSSDMTKHYQIENPHKQKPTPLSIGDLSAMMVAHIGGTPEQWERTCSMHYALAVLQTAMKQDAAEGKSAIDDARLNAQGAMGVCIQRIKDKRKAEA